MISVKKYGTDGWERVKGWFRVSEDLMGEVALISTPESVIDILRPEIIQFNDGSVFSNLMAERGKSPWNLKQMQVRTCQSCQHAVDGKSLVVSVSGPYLRCDACGRTIATLKKYIIGQ